MYFLELFFERQHFNESLSTRYVIV